MTSTHSTNHYPEAVSILKREAGFHDMMYKQHLPHNPAAAQQHYDIWVELLHAASILKQTVPSGVLPDYARKTP